MQEDRYTNQPVLDLIIAERDQLLEEAVSYASPLSNVVRTWPGEPTTILKEQIEILKLIRNSGQKIEDLPHNSIIEQSENKIASLILTKTQAKKRRETWSCTYCQQKGHLAEFCAKKPNLEFRTDPNLSQKEKQFIERLLADDDKSSKHEEKTDRGEKIEQWKQRGTELNKNNPWAETKEASHVQRVRSKLGFWKAAGCSKTVLTWLAAGIKTKFEREPPRLAFRPTQGQLQHTEFIHTEVMKHIKDGSFKVVSRKFAAIINPITVDEKKGKLRMCIDTRFPNSYLAAPAFKNEMIETVISLIIQKNDYLLSTDISKAYYCVPLHESVQKYFCFEHAGLVICPKILVFGLNEAPYYFNKIIREMVKFCRSMGIKMTSYFDDQLWADSSKPAAEKLALIIQEIFANLGLLLNEKAKLTPEQVAEHIGWQINTVSMTIHRSPDKAEETSKVIKNMLRNSQRRTNLSTLSSVVGQLSAMRTAIPAVGCWTVEIYKDIGRNTEYGWEDKNIQLSPNSWDELKFWDENLTRLNRIGSPIEAPALQTTVYCDASEEGWGAIVAQKGETLRLFGPLPENLIGKSSTLREIHGLAEALKQMKTRENQHIRVRLDSQAGYYIANKGYSKKTDINTIMKDIWLKKFQENVYLRVEWIPREENKQADQMSRIALSVPERTKREIETKLNDKKLRWQLPTQAPDLLVIRPDLNWVGVAILLMEKRKQIVGIIHPIWRAQPWWTRVVSQSKRTIALSDGTWLSLFDFR
jgi:ribonuclease HI